MTHPHLAGLDYVSTLGSGGYADVFAYDQRVPARRVAVKVLRDAATSGSAAAAFLAEADAMARLGHPNIVEVHSVGVADDGRPYLVMPCHPGPNLGQQSRDGRLSVAEVLRIGVLVGGAVETAHRHGLLHRDIKPANILTSRYGTPALTDFGLAGTPADADGADVGVSVPWAAPEMLFGTAPASVRSDVYSLGATLWTLLTGRSPFELAGAQNRPAAMLQRIRLDPAPPTGRADVPAVLEELLARSMAKDAAARPASALEFVAGLQDAERALGLPLTEPVVGDPRDAARAEAPAAGVVRASGLLGQATRGLDPTVLRAQLSDAAPLDAPLPPPSDAPLPPPPEAPLPPPSGAPSVRPRLLWPALAVAAALTLALAIVLASRPGSSPPVQASITASRDGDRATFAWSYPGQRPDDTFNVAVADRVVTRGRPTVELAGAGPHCVRVQVLDASGAPRGPYTPQWCA